MFYALKKKTNYSEAEIKSFLQPFDLLGRTENLKTKKIEIPARGNITLRTGFNNYDSTRSNAIDEVVQLILFAKNNIFIKDQFLFDRNVIAALIEAKQKNPLLDVRIILEPVESSKPKGLPNILYLDILKQAGIETKFKKLHVGWSLENIEKTSFLHMEYHAKTISADGKYVIAGSANKDQATMYGAFREEQVEIFDEVSTKIHDDNFNALWNDTHETTESFKEFEFEVPPQIKGLNGKPLSAQEFIKLLRHIISILFDSQSIS